MPKLTPKELSLYWSLRARWLREDAARQEKEHFANWLRKEADAADTLAKQFEERHTHIAA